MPGRQFWPAVWCGAFLVSLWQYRGTLAGGFDDYDPTAANWRDTRLVLRLGREATPVRYFIEPLPPIHIFYRPGTVVWFWAMSRPLGDHPSAWRIWGLAVNAGVAALLGLLVSACAGSRAPGALTTLAFALWGAHWQVLTWIACQPDLAATGLAVGALVALWRDRWKWGCRVALSAGLFLAALLTKETAAYLPLLVAATVPLWPVRDDARRRAAALGAFALVSALYLALRYLALGGLAAGLDAPGLPSLSASLRAYARLLWPPAHSLMLLLPSLSLGWTLLLTDNLWRVLGQQAVYYGGALLLVWRARRATLTFALWLVLAPLPTLHCLALPQERYMYLASMGWAALTGLLIWQVGQVTLEVAKARRGSR